MKTLVNIRHSGIVVHDVEESLNFYTKLLDLEEIGRGRLEQYEVLKLLGIVDSNLTWIKLSPEDKSCLVELYYIENEALREHYFDFRSENCFVDFSHLAFTVKDIEALYQKLAEKGMDIHCPPSIDHECKHNLFFTRDPNGHLIEFVEVI